MHFKHRNEVRKAAARRVATVDAARRPRRLRRRSTRRRCGATDADPFYFFPPAYWERLERAAARPLRRACIDGEVGRERALPADAAVAALPPQRARRDAGRATGAIDAPPPRGRALGAGERLRALPPRRRRSAARRDSLHEFKRALRPGGPGRGRRRQGDPRRGRLPRAERRRGAATTASSLPTGRR